MSENVSHFKVEQGSERGFGLVFAAVFLIIFLFPLIMRGITHYWVLAVAAAFAIIAFVAPHILKPLNTLWFKFGMLLGLGLFVLSMALVALWPSLFTFGIALIFSLVGKAIFDPSRTSYVADHISYEKRGTAIGFLEFAWSLAFIVGIPAVGLLIARSGWWAR